MSVFSETGTFSPFNFFCPFSLTQSPLCQHYFSHFRSGFPNFVERFFCICMKFVFYPTTKKLLPDKVLFISEPARKKPSLLLFIFFYASIHVTATGITAAVSYNKKLPIYYTKSFCFPRFYSRLTDFFHEIQI